MSSYDVGISISLIDHVSAGLAAIGGRMSAIGAHAAHLNSSLMMIGKGAGLAFVGVQGLQALSAPLDKAKEFQTEAAKFGTLGFGAKINKEAEDYARGMKTIGTSTIENMSIVGDAMAVFKDIHEAKFAAPIMAKMKFANEAFYGKEGGEARDKALMDMMKVIEFRKGTTSEKEFATQADYAQKAISGSRNRVNPAEMLQALKTGGVGLSRRSNEAFYLKSEPLIQEFGGSRYGTAVMSIYQNLVQARGAIAAQQEMYRIGLIREDAAVFNKLGKLKKFKAGGMIGSDVLEKEGEQAFLEKVLLPKFKEHGITKEEDVIREIGQIMGNRTGSALMARIYQQREKLTMQGEANVKAESLGDTEKRASETAAGKSIMLHEKWNSLLEAAGTAILPLAIQGLQGLINVVNGITSFAQKYPVIFKGLVIGFVALMGAMAIGGTIMMLVGAFRLLGMATGTGQLLTALPMVKTAITALGEGVLFLGRALLMNPIGLTLTAIAIAAYLVYRNWSTIKPLLIELSTLAVEKFNMIKLKATDAIEFVVNKWNSGVAMIKSAVSSVIAFIVGAFQSIVGAIGGAFSGISGMVGSVKSMVGMGSNTSMKLPSSTAKSSASFVNPAANQPIFVSTALNVDGHKMANVVTKHQTKAANRPQTGPSRFDDRMALGVVGGL